MQQKITIQLILATLLMAISFTLTAHDKVVVIPLGGSDDLTQCNVSNCLPVNELTLTCPSGNAVIPCDFGESKVVFITSSVHQGNLGGLDGADAICNDRASEANLPGLYRAWLSTGSSSPSNRFSQSGSPIRMTNGVRVAFGYSSLTSTALQSPINIDENGVPVSFGAEVWTNTTPTGSNNFGVGAESEICSNWTSNSPSFEGRIGTSSETGDLWTTVIFPGFSCSNSFHLYCFEQ